jgi:hypothetical protein
MGTVVQGTVHRRWGRRWPGVLPVALIGVGCNALDFLHEAGGLAIQRFTASPAEISAGGVASLSWEVEGAETVQIEGIGTVPPKGSRQVSPAWSTTYVLTARAGTSSAAATLQVVVQPGPSPSPTPSGSPTPSPSPSVAPTPTPSPSPSPSSSPSASPTPAAASCGAPAEAAGNCLVNVTKPVAVPAGQCIEVTSVAATPACPVGFSTPRAVTFRVTAHTTRARLEWRRAANSGDVVEPASGRIAPNGTTEVTLTDIVLDDRLRIEIVDGNDVLARFMLRHY